MTADSSLALATFKAAVTAHAARVVDYAGPILHTDRPVPSDGGATADPWLKTFVDWTALSQADVLLSSVSGFGWTAGWAGRVPYVRMVHDTKSCAWLDFESPTKLHG